MNETACGVVKGADIVVARARDTYVYSLQSNLWRQGPPLARNLRLLASTQIGQTFSAVGGVDDDVPAAVDDIYRFDEDSYTWILEEAKLLHQPKSGVAAVTLPDDFIPC